MYLLLAVELTSLLMKHLPRKLWRAVHLTSFLVFAGVSVHAVEAGTDVGDAVMQWFGLGSVALVGFLAMFRVVADRRVPRSATAGAAAARRDAPAINRPSAQPHSA